MTMQGGMAETKQPLNAQIIHAGDGPQDAVPLGHEIYMSRDISNACRILTPAGDVLVNTLQHNNRENFSEVRWLEGQVSTLREALSQVPA